MGVEIKPIRSEADHQWALHEIERLWGAPHGTVEGDTLDILIALANDWENKNVVMDPPDPIEAIRFRLDQRGEDEKALEGLIGSRSRVHEILNYKRPLSLNMIRQLHDKLGISADVLIIKPKQASTKRPSFGTKPPATPVEKSRRTASAKKARKPSF